MYTHIYIHVDGAWCVCGVLPYSLEWTSRLQANQVTERGRVCMTKGGEGGGIESLVPVDYTARPSRCFFLNFLNPSIHADILPHHSAHLMLLA